MLDKILYVFLAIALITGVARLFINGSEEGIVCTADVGMCSDGSTVGRVAPTCQFSACPSGAKLVQDIVPTVDGVACTMDAMLCPDGSHVGRSGPKCEFVCPNLPVLDPVIQASIDAKSDLIKLISPLPLGVIGSSLSISGQARGPWFFEASFPVTLTNWDGLIIAEGIATAEGDWMTTEFVPFSATLNFVNPYLEGNPDFMKKGSLILQKDNPSGLPEHDDALEIPIRFAK